MQPKYANIDCIEHRIVDCDVVRNDLRLVQRDVVCFIDGD